MTKFSEIEKKVSTLNHDQSIIFEEMENNTKRSIIIPTGCGKGYLMQVHILNSLFIRNINCVAIATHRLMLNTQHFLDIIETLLDYSHNVGFLFVGSDGVTLSEGLTNKLNKLFYKKNNSTNNKFNIKRNISTNIKSRVTKTSDVTDITKKWLQDDYKVVIISTYHSLNTLKNIDIDYLYCDEAHTLATNEQKSKFIDNFMLLNYKKVYFFTATSKDEATTISKNYLMNNTTIFGERSFFSFKHAIKEGYICTPILHILKPVNEFEGDDIKINDKLSFILNAIKTHRNELKDFEKKSALNSNRNERRIKEKLLIKCSNVNEVWELFFKLRDVLDLEKYVICAGASKGYKNSNEYHFINYDVINNRGDFLSKMGSIDKENNKRMIVLHYDILSEGININGFTGLMLLTDELLTISKILQNIGRCTRLNHFDRERLTKKQITTDNYDNWVKPFCYVILPLWNTKGVNNYECIKNVLYALRYEYDYTPSYKLSVGNDMPKGIDASDYEGLNILDFNDDENLVLGILSEIEDIKEINEEQINSSKNLIDKISVHSKFKTMLKKYGSEDDIKLFYDMINQKKLAEQKIEILRNSILQKSKNVLVV